MMLTLSPLYADTTGSCVGTSHPATATTDANAIHFAYIIILSFYCSIKVNLKEGIRAVNTVHLLDPIHINDSLLINPLGLGSKLPTIPIYSFHCRNKNTRFETPHVAFHMFVTFEAVTNDRVDSLVRKLFWGVVQHCNDRSPELM